MKYEFTAETRDFSGNILYRIRSISDFTAGTGLCIEAGTLGGWIEKEDNLSQSGGCWVYDDAQVFGNAQVLDNACIRGDAIIHGNARVYENSFVYGNVNIFGHSKIFGNASISQGAWIYDYAEVSGYARVSSSRVGDTSKVFGHSVLSHHMEILDDAYIGSCKDYFSISNLNRRNNLNEVVTFMKSKGNNIIVSAPYFRGTIDDFIEVIKENCFFADLEIYRLAIELAKQRIGLGE